MGWSVQSNKMPLHPQVSLDPFEKWALDFMGPITPMSKKKRYSLVCMDYVTKWVEEKYLLKVNEELVVDFLYKDIFTIF